MPITTGAKPGGLANGPKGLAKKALSGAGWTSLATAGRQILSLACVGILAHLLGPEAYGLMAMTSIVMVFVLNFRDLGTASAVIQRSEISENLVSSLFWVNCGIGLLLSALVFLSARPMAAFFHEPRVIGLLEILSLSCPISSAGLVHNALLTRNMAFRGLAIADIASAVGGYLVAIPCAFAGFGVWSLVFASLANAIISTACYMFMSGWTPRLRFDFAEIRSIAHFSLNLSGFGLVNYFARNADNIVVGRYLGKVSLGVYQMAYTLMLYPLQNISSLIGQVLLSPFSRIKEDDERFRTAYIKSSMLTGLITFPVMLGMGVVADPLVRALLGSTWLPVIPLFQILAPVGLVQSVQTFVGLIYVAKGRTDWMLRWSLVSTTLLVICFLAGARFGVRGVAIAYDFTYFGLLMYPGFRIPFRLIGLSSKRFARALWPKAAISLVMAAVCAGWLLGIGRMQVSNAWFRLLSTSLLGVLVYIGLMAKIRPGVILCLEETIGNSGSVLARRCLRAIGFFPE
jgi:O-antigen/teichoic acid export membrane protein